MIIAENIDYLQETKIRTFPSNAAYTTAQFQYNAWATPPFATTDLLHETPINYFQKKVNYNFKSATH